MTAPTRRIGVALASVAALAGAAIALQAQAETKAAPQQQCFYQSQWSGWSAPSRDVLYIRTRTNELYRVDLTDGSPLLQSSSARIANLARSGSDRICGPNDLDLRVSDGSFAIPIRAQAITRLTAAPGELGEMREAPVVR